jgi:hypothetical protein
MGREGDEAVLVTRDRTFAVRKGETSNAQLLIPASTDALVRRGNGGEHGEGTYQVVANVMEHYELFPTGPRLRMLPQLLAQRPYTGPDWDAEDDMDPSAAKRFTRAELEATFQASPGELAAELLRLGALEVDGRFCLMGMKYESSLMHHFFADAPEHGWDLAAIRPSVCWTSSKDLASYPRFVLRAFFQKYKKQVHKETGDDNCEPAASAQSGDDAMDVEGGASAAKLTDSDSEPQAMDMAKMALFCADDLIAGTRKPLTVENFKLAWKAMMPLKTEEDIFDLATLRGRAVIEPQGAELVVKKFRVEDLAADVKTRFKELFQQSARWSKEDLVPYLHDLVSPSCTADQLLLKHTRLVRQPGSDVKTYCART